MDFQIQIQIHIVLGQRKYLRNFDVDLGHNEWPSLIEKVILVGLEELREIEILARRSREHELSGRCIGVFHRVREVRNAAPLCIPMTIRPLREGVIRPVASFFGDEERLQVSSVQVVGEQDRPIRETSLRVDRRIPANFYKVAAVRRKIEPDNRGCHKRKVIGLLTVEEDFDMVLGEVIKCKLVVSDNTEGYITNE